MKRMKYKTIKLLNLSPNYSIRLIREEEKGKKKGGKEINKENINLLTLLSSQLSSSLTKTMASNLISCMHQKSVTIIPFRASNVLGWVGGLRTP